MNKQSILDFEVIASTYQNSIPCRQLEKIKERNWLPVVADSILSADVAYLVGKITGDGHLSKKFATQFVGQKEEFRNL